MISPPSRYVLFRCDIMLTQHFQTFSLPRTSTWTKTTLQHYKSFLILSNLKSYKLLLNQFRLSFLDRMLTSSTVNIEFTDSTDFNLENYNTQLTKLPYDDESDENQMTDLETNDSESNENLRTLSTLKKRLDPRGPYQVQKNVELLLEKWGKVIPIPPWLFLLKLLKSRGYDHSFIKCCDKKM